MGAAEFWDEGGVDVDDFIFEFFDEWNAQNAHVAHENNEVDVFLSEGGGHFLVEFFASFIFRIDEGGLKSLLFGALNGVAILFIASDQGELDAGHFAGLYFINNGLKIGTVGGGEDSDFEHVGIIADFICILFYLYFR